MNGRLRVSFLACVLGVAAACGQELVSSSASGLGSSGPFVKGEGAFRGRRSPLTSGVPVGLSIPVVEGPSIWIADQFTIVVPDGATSLWIELVPDDQADDFVFFVRYSQPVELTDGNVIFDFGSFTNGWYEELGLWGSVVQPGTYYIAIATFTLDGGTLTLTATVDGGVVDLVSGTAVACRVPSDDVAAGDAIVSPELLT